MSCFVYIHQSCKRGMKRGMQSILRVGDTSKFYASCAILLSDLKQSKQSNKNNCHDCDKIKHVMERKTFVFPNTLLFKQKTNPNVTSKCISIYYKLLYYCLCHSAKMMNDTNNNITIIISKALCCSNHC